jgi:hypothetical protein
MQARGTVAKVHHAGSFTTPGCGLDQTGISDNDHLNLA